MINLRPYWKMTMCHVSGPSWDEMACNTSLLWRCDLSYCMCEMSLSSWWKSSGGKATCWLGSGIEISIWSERLWFHVSICLGETEHTQQTYLWVWTVWLCSGVSKALDSSTVGFSWGRVVQYSSAETELPSVDLNVSLYRPTVQHKGLSKTQRHIWLS